MPPSPDPWLPFVRPNPSARLRLFCLPFAGGGAAVFRGWADGLPASVQVCAVQPPGRETRYREPAYDRLAPLIVALADALRPYLDRPYALFGHSMGAAVVFELARELRRRGERSPERLAVSGRGAPHLPPRHGPLHTLPEPEFRAELRRMRGTPAAVLDNDELMRVFLPTLRADFAAHGTYACTAEPPLDCPVLALGGVQDPLAPYADLDAWRQHTRSSFELRMLNGDHFFLQSQRPLVLQYLARFLEPAPPA
jgi:medium-chain acyl-[acyl-carrier-protein] hydrolase